MTLSVTHPFVNAVPDGSDATVTRPSNWNAAHTLTGQADVSQGGTGLASGTSGGIPYFNSTSTMLSSALLAAGLFVVGGGAGVAPSTITNTVATAQLNQFTSTLQGLVPGSGGGTVNFLRADGTWASPAGGSSLQLQYNNAGTFAGANVWRTGVNQLDLSNSATAQQLRIYNTTDNNGGAPTNGEWGTIDWTTSANILTIGAQAAGGGTARAIALVGNGFPSGIIYAGTIKVLAFDQTAVYFRSNSGLGWSGSTVDPYAATTTGIVQVATKVISFADGNFVANNGWFQWGGQSRVSGSDFSTGANNTNLANVTGLTANVQAGRTYSFEAYLSWTDAAAGGVQAAIAGTCTATAIRYDGWIVDSAANGIKGNAPSTGLGGAVANSTTTGTAGVIIIKGTITVANAGTLTVQFAQNTNSATPSLVKIGSYFIVYDMP